ncbi:Ribosomal RNA large subunit methyltransferase G [Arcanobacterium haemolyticum]|uniref:class I SAM-dependent methyltransferase n=1 Tax=Arcanobacterium haemolyticum TaxID=28264 RepID=UPI000D916DE7|nr:methyltransferase [Arcanobacterium haemolyticum]SPT75890.1 Ribosomal RNA large subunit methyltransferase G [Arcanobacterium haemolyticum]
MNSHYFSTVPDVSSAPHSLTYSAFDREWTVTVDSGVFSPSGLDKGTAVLLHKVPISDLEPGSVVADIGCGWGPITLVLADTYPDARVVACDVNERAVALASKNCSDLGFSNVQVGLADDVVAQLRDEISRGVHSGIDVLWSNPPIRIGKDELHKLLLTWLGLLSPSGHAYMVVQKNLGADSLAKWIDAQGFPTEKIGSAKGFRILHVRKR